MRLLCSPEETPDAPARALVMEAMILAGEVAARFASERGVEVFFRGQNPPSGPVFEAAQRVLEDNPNVIPLVRDSLRVMVRRGWGLLLCAACVRVRAGGRFRFCCGRVFVVMRWC